MKRDHWTKELAEFCTSIRDYIADPTDRTAGDVMANLPDSAVQTLAESISSESTWNAESEACASLLIRICAARASFIPMSPFQGVRENDILCVHARMSAPPSMEELGKIFLETRDMRWILRDDPEESEPFDSPFANLAWKFGDFSKPIPIHGGLVRALARWRTPILIARLQVDPKKSEDALLAGYFLAITEETDRADALLLEAIGRLLVRGPHPSNPYSLEAHLRREVFKQVFRFNDLRHQRYDELVIELASKPEFAMSELAVETLLKHRRNEVLDLVAAGDVSNIPSRMGAVYRELTMLALQHADGSGGKLLGHIISRDVYYHSAAKILLEWFSESAKPEHISGIRHVFLNYASGLKGKNLADFWKIVASIDMGIFRPEWEQMAIGKSKPLREAAAAWLQAHQSGHAEINADALLSSNDSKQRLMGISMLAASGTAEAIARLKNLHAVEPTKQVRIVIAGILSKYGIDLPPEPAKQVEAINDLVVFEELLASRAKTIRMPKSPWLDVAKLPSLFSKDGRPLSQLVTIFIMQHQARVAGELEDNVAPLLCHLDRDRNAPFAHALLDQWFASDMKAPTRWALDVAGIVGDDTIIERLTKPISHWCQENRGSRAEWAAHAISLLATETALGTLDGLIQKYRNHRKYVGEAASIAIQTAAASLGISDDELSERIVPDFGFDSNCRREFETGSGKLTAQLGSDFKILWLDPESNEVTTNPEFKLPPEVDEDLKATRKSLKEIVARQIPRFQNAMISGRRWPIDLWRTRFENHPVFRIFAMRLIWGVYDEAESLIRTFRLYPNGLTASSGGNLEEFSEPATTVGVVHGLELDGKTSKEWVAHFRRFKIKPLFKQADRPVYSLDPLHGNRKELRLTEGVRITAGKLRAGLLTSGWSLGSAGDGGWVGCMFRKFPRCAVDVYLPVSELHAASSKNEEVVLESAFFARGTKGKRAYRDRLDEAEALPFDQVPPIIYSETLGDLTSLIAD